MNAVLEQNLQFLSREMTEENELFFKISLHNNEMLSLSERIKELEGTKGYNLDELAKAKDKRKKMREEISKMQFHARHKANMIKQIELRMKHEKN
tara:strand:+ start:2542 stop:2826 length:285 start_codon:yes stop_codon:yes gene_type:complete